MPRKRQLKFKVGDVVKIYGRRTGVITSSPNNKQWYYSIELFNELNPLGAVFVDSQLSLCEGINTPNICIECEYRDLCPHLQDIARCKISEFGQLRREGKYNPDVCKQRQCKHLGVCLTTRFIPK